MGSSSLTSPCKKGRHLIAILKWSRVSASNYVMKKG
uniref:Uncharacterized protein n=1 Tax=Arundo donax TaxID=35708 RepID=A0A0A9HUF7_ARUDO